MKCRKHPEYDILHSQYGRSSNCIKCLQEKDKAYRAKQPWFIREIEGLSAFMTSLIGSR